MVSNLEVGEEGPDGRHDARDLVAEHGRQGESHLSDASESRTANLLTSWSSDDCESGQGFERARTITEADATLFAGGCLTGFHSDLRLLR
jgi:hypothetical protein